MYEYVYESGCKTYTSSLRCRHYQHYHHHHHHHHHHHRQSVMLLVIASVVSPKPQDTRLSPVIGSLDCGPYRYTENTKLFQSLSSRENIKKNAENPSGFSEKVWFKRNRDRSFSKADRSGSIVRYWWIDNKKGYHIKYLE